MKLVTYNVNGLRQRVSQFGSLLKLLDSFDADIICFQETKLRRQELTADLAMAEGYESFFSCTLTCEKGRTGYSGVATFCRVKSAFSSCEVNLPVAADESMSGLVNNNSKDGKNEVSIAAEGLEEIDKEELLKVDSEGRCIITDHEHFVVFNIYGPRAEADNAERIEFKRKFYNVLERRWECLLRRGRRVFVVGDLNIAPFAIDRCDAGPDFEKNEFRKWFRALLIEFGGSFSDVFRAQHPERRDAYTCWCSNTGAEQFNYGSRIDHILVSGSCLHQDPDNKVHNFCSCHVKECDIMTEYKRLKHGDAPKRWKGGWGMKLQGSDHVPVYISFEDFPDVSQHNTPPLASRYLPMIYGFQQTLVSVLMKRSQPVNCSVSGALRNEASSSLETESTRICDSSNGKRKQARKSQSSSQLSLKSFFTSQSSDHNSLESEMKSEDEQQDGTSIGKEKNEAALMEWQRIQSLMQNSIPLCKGHKEQCVARVVKKPGPTFGRRFYVCARAEGPSSNPEANCGFFKWASSKFREK